MVVFFGLGYVLLRHTTLGRYILSIGSSRRAAYISGVSVDTVKIAVFALMGLFVAVVALLLTGRMYSASPVLGIGWEFQIIATVVLGGTSLKGGSCTLLGTFFAALFFATLNNGMNLLHVDAYWQYVAVGLVLMAAVALDGVRNRLSGADKSG
jgi:ribose transport system permease protein